MGRGPKGSSWPGSRAVAGLMVPRLLLLLVAIGVAGCVRDLEGATQADAVQGPPEPLFLALDGEILVSAGAEAAGVDGCEGRTAAVQRPMTTNVLQVEPDPAHVALNASLTSEALFASFRVCVRGPDLEPLGTAVGPGPLLVEVELEGLSPLYVEVLPDNTSPRAYGPSPFRLEVGVS